MVGVPAVVTVPREEGKKGAVEVEQRLEGRRERRVTLSLTEGTANG